MIIRLPLEWIILFSIQHKMYCHFVFFNGIQSDWTYYHKMYYLAHSVDLAYYNSLSTIQVTLAELCGRHILHI